MSPIGHLQYGWWFAHWKQFDRRERAAVALAGAACDLDGLSLFWGSDTYYRYHHILFHNVGSLLAVIPLAGILFWRKPWAWLLVVFAFGMHIVEDYVSIPWDMYPWRPFNSELVNLGHLLPPWVVQYVFQTAAMLFIVSVTVWIYARYKRTPIEIISPALDRLILNYAVVGLRNRCAACPNHARFRCDHCGRTFCAGHAKVGWRCGVTCAGCAANRQAAV